MRCIIVGSLQVLKRMIFVFLVVLLVLGCSKHHSSPPVVVQGVTAPTDCANVLQDGEYQFKDGSFWVDSASTNGTITLVGIAGIDFWGDSGFIAGYLGTNEAAYYTYFDSTAKISFTVLSNPNFTATLPRAHYDGVHTIQFGNGAPYTLAGFSQCDGGSTYILTNSTQRLILRRLPTEEAQERRKQIFAKLAASAPSLQ